MKIKSLLRFVLLLACLTIGVETYAEAEGTIEIQLISKKGLVFPFDPEYDKTNTYILSSGTTALDGLRILATVGNTPKTPLKLKTESDNNGITIGFDKSLVSLVETGNADGSYYVVIAGSGFDQDNQTSTITFEYEGYATRTITFKVVDTTIM